MAEFGRGALNRTSYDENGRLGTQAAAGQTDYRGVKGEAPHFPRPGYPGFPRGSEPRFPRGGRDGNPDESSDYRFTKLVGYGR